MAAALGKPMISLHDPGLNHALKEVDGAALAVAETPEQVVQVLTYAMTGKLQKTQGFLSPSLFFPHPAGAAVAWLPSPCFPSGVNHYSLF